MPCCGATLAAIHWIGQLGHGRWHIEPGFGIEAPDFLDVVDAVPILRRGEGDAPTRLRAGSHFDVARVLAPEEEVGMM